MDLTYSHIQEKMARRVHVAVLNGDGAFPTLPLVLQVLC